MSDPIFELANVHFVTDFLAVGGDLDGYDDEKACAQALELVDAGISHVLDVRQECDDAELWSHLPEIAYRHDGIDDAGQQVPTAWFAGVVEWALEAIAEGGVVLTHCHMGINRGPSAGFAVLLGLGWDPVDALAAIRAARPIAAIDYAEDALAWHFEATSAAPQERVTTLQRVGRWRRDNPLDVVRIIRSIRMEERSAALAVQRM
jgi:dual specificity phosphatase 3